MIRPGFIGFLCVVTTAWLVLGKLVGVVSWTWAAVLIPLWLPVLIVGASICLATAVYMVMGGK